MGDLLVERVPLWRRWLRVLGIGARLIALVLLTGWAAAALYFDVPVAWLRLPAAIVYAVTMLAVLAIGRRRPLATGICLVGFALVLGWWFSIPPSNTRPWQPDVVRTAWAEIDGDRVTVHDVRNCEYRTETDYTPRWETRSFDLSTLRGIDFFITLWGSPWIAHPILSFQFGDNDHLAISIETRKEVGEDYSAFRGFFRQYELTYIVADERDVIRLRTNYRKGEEVYLYRARVTPQRVRAIFLDYLKSVNRLHEEPEWYNAATSNCTTNIRIHTVATAPGPIPPWDWRILLNGRVDEMVYERAGLAGDALPFPELKRRAHINPAARAADQAPDFSRRIREGRPAF